MTALLHRMVDQAADRRPEAAAVRCDGAELTWGELASRANGLARVLVGAGRRVRCRTRCTGHLLAERDNDQLVFGRDPEFGSGASQPFVFPDRGRFGVDFFDAHREARALESLTDVRADEARAARHQYASAQEASEVFTSDGEAG